MNALCGRWLAAARSHTTGHTRPFLACPAGRTKAVAEQTGNLSLALAAGKVTQLSVFRMTNRHLETSGTVLARHLLYAIT